MTSWALISRVALGQRRIGQPGTAAAVRLAAASTRLAHEVVITSARPSITTALPTRHSVSSVTRRRATSTALTQTLACTVWPGRTRARQLSCGLRQTVAGLDNRLANAAEITLAVKKPCAMQPPKRVVAANSSLTCRALLSPETPANDTTSASVIAWT